jgi:hypothetical protein
MPVFVLKAQDRLTLFAVAHYLTLCEVAACDEQALEVRKALKEIADWQTRNPEKLKFPDHKHVSCR